MAESLNITEEQSKANPKVQESSASCDVNGETSQATRLRTTDVNRASGLPLSEIEGA